MIAFSCAALALQQTDIAERIYRDASPAVVTILAGDVQGSGFIIGPRRIVTALHVVAAAKGANQVVLVTYSNGTRSFASVDATDKTTDLATLVATEAPTVKPLSYCRKTSSLPPVGRHVFVISSPHGLELSMSEGIIAGRREGPLLPASGGSFMLLQITAAVSPGSSGGPVLDSSGTVVGVVDSYLVDSENVNFAVASDSIDLACDSQFIARREFNELQQEQDREVAAFNRGQAKIAIYWDLDSKRNDPTGADERLFSYYPARGFSAAQAGYLRANSEAGYIGGQPSGRLITVAVDGVSYVIVWYSKVGPSPAELQHAKTSIRHRRALNAIPDQESREDHQLFAFVVQPSRFLRDGMPWRYLAGSYTIMNVDGADCLVWFTRHSKPSDPDLAHIRRSISRCMIEARSPKSRR